MKMIIGGAFQGKLEYARKTYGAEEGWIDGKRCALQEIESCRGIYHFHEYIRRLPDDAEDPIGMERQAEEFVEQLYRKNPEILLVSDEVGCGVIPIDRKDRIYREKVGRICTYVAKKSDEVVRVICGTGIRIK